MQRFNSIANTLDTQQTMVNGQLSQLTEQVNIQAKKIADLNQQVINRQSGGTDHQLKIYSINVTMRCVHYRSYFLLAVLNRVMLLIFILAQDNP